MELHRWGKERFYKPVGQSAKQAQKAACAPPTGAYSDGKLMNSRTLPTKGKVL
jgi:hypothetical protein